MVTTRNFGDVLRGKLADTTKLAVLVDAARDLLSIEDELAAMADENTLLKKQNAELLALCEQLQLGRVDVQVIADHLASGLVAKLQQYQAGDNRMYAELSEAVVEFDPEGDMVPPACVGRVRLAGAEDDDDTVPVMFRLRRPFYDAEVVQ